MIEWARGPRRWAQLARACDAGGGLGGAYLRWNAAARRLGSARCSFCFCAACLFGSRPAGPQQLVPPIHRAQELTLVIFSVK